jgi:hypothetical protein
MKIEFLAGVSFRRDLNLFVWQPRGILDEAHVEQVLSMLEEVEDEAHEPFDRFTDMSMLDDVELSFDYIFKVSLYRRVLYLNRAPVKSAMLVVDEDTARVALTHATVTVDSPLQVAVFVLKAPAADWLSVDLSDLEVDH